MRASLVAQTRHARAPSRAFSATTRRLSIGSTGLSTPKARPCVTEHAVRSPVKAPGPRANAMASRSRRPIAASSSNRMIVPIRRVEAFAPPGPSWMPTRSSTPTATIIRSVPVSRASRAVMRRGEGRCAAWIADAATAPGDSPGRTAGGGERGIIVASLAAAVTRSSPSRAASPLRRGAPSSRAIIARMSLPTRRSSSIAMGAFAALLLAAAALCEPAFAARRGASAAAPAGLPPGVAAALQRARVPASSMVAWVEEAGTTTPRLAWQDERPANPASLMKLVTTFAGLDLLGPAFTWSTPVWLDGRLDNGTLDGDLVIKGYGDPKLTLERIWLLLRRVRQAGVRDIRGAIVVDRSAFAPGNPDPADFDGEPLRPYNAGADALLLDFRSIMLTFTPDPVHGVATVSMDPPLAGVRVDATVPLTGGACDDWRG